MFNNVLNNIFKNNDSLENKFISNLSKKILNNKKYLCIFGAARLGTYIHEKLIEINPLIEVDFYCDNDKNKEGLIIYKGTRCISINNLIEYKNDIKVIIASHYHTDINKQLMAYGFNNEDIIEVFDKKYLDFNFNYWGKLNFLHNKISEVLELLEDDESKRVYLHLINNLFLDDPKKMTFSEITTDNQGYPKEIIKLNSEEVFVDCGAYDGDTMEEFMKRVNGKFKSIIAFEMDEVNYKNLLNRINLYDAETKKKIFTYNCGVWNKKENIAFSNNGLRTSSILDNSQEVKDKENYFTVDLLDEIIDSRITYLKMDIEGAEKKALIGAEKIIKKYKPKLAISIYHQIEDLWEIPILVKKYLPEYNIYIRHHRDYNSDTTMCYATIKI